MKLIYKEDPKEWRKSTLTTVLGLAVLASLLRWRYVISINAWCGILAVMFVIAICAWLKPRWFRGWYRVSLCLGFVTSQFVGRVLLILFFVFILTPIGLLLRLAGKDLLQLKLQRNKSSYWERAKNYAPLERLF